MMLKNLLHDFAVVSTDLAITGLALDSRKVKTGNLFIALSGSREHGLSHAAQAINNGAIAIVYDPSNGGEALAKTITVIMTVPVEQLHLKLGMIAARYYQHPSQKLAVIGITGTNGKTSCSHFISQLLGRCAIIGTLGWGERGQLHETQNTTPDALALQAMLHDFCVEDQQNVAMEVSSHALAQGRVNGMQFKGVVFTNISQDHLDYHGDMESYFQTKLSLLDKPGIEFVVVNLDDVYSQRVIERVKPETAIWGVSTQGKSDENLHCLRAKDIKPNSEGISFTVEWQKHSYTLHISLYGGFNVSNILLSLAAALAMQMPVDEAIKAVQLLQPITGRMEPLGGGILPLVFIDYAHTPDALDKVLASVRMHCNESLWVVFGCGGNRDKGKRPQMGTIAAENADYVIVTDDNPRFEQSIDIIQDILEGCPEQGVDIIPDRKSAIQHAILTATGQDCIVIAGKGHETYQDIRGIKHPFNDRLVVMDALDMRILNL